MCFHFDKKTEKFSWKLCLNNSFNETPNGVGFPGTGNIGPKTAGNREHLPQNSREQGTFIKNSGTTEHWVKNSREPGTLAEKQPGTWNDGLKSAGNRNIGLKIAGNREQSMKSNVEITNPSMKEL